MFKNRPGSRIKIAQEYISEQKDGFGRQVEVVFEEIIDYTKSHPKESAQQMVKTLPQFRLLEEITFKRFGLRISIVHNAYTLMGVLPMLLNKYHTFLNQGLHGFSGIEAQETVMKGWGEQEGTINLKKAKVGGMFSTYVHTFFINTAALIGEVDLNAKELTAAYLHEIGHLFNNYEFSNRLEASNTLMANLAQELKHPSDDKKLTYLYKEYLDLTGNSDDRDLLTSGKSRVVIGSRIFKGYFGYVKSQWPNSKYMETNSEASADLFAARFGYGRDLVIGMYKINEKYSFEHSPRLLSYMSFITDVMLLGLPLVAAGFSIAVGAIPLGLVMLLMLGMNMYNTGKDLHDMTYDDLKDRYLRIRQQYVQMLKDGDIDRAAAESVLESIYATDRIIKSTGSFKPLVTRLGNIVFSRHRNADNDIQLQRLIEELAHNELFIKATEFNLAVKAAA